MTTDSDKNLMSMTDKLQTIKQELFYVYLDDYITKVQAEEEKTFL